MPTHFLGCRLCGHIYFGSGPFNAHLIPYIPELLVIARRKKARSTPPHLVSILREWLRSSGRRDLAEPETDECAKAVLVEFATHLAKTLDSEAEGVEWQSRYPERGNRWWTQRLNEVDEAFEQDPDSLPALVTAVFQRAEDESIRQPPPVDYRRHADRAGGQIAGAIMNVAHSGTVATNTKSTHVSTRNSQRARNVGVASAPHMSSAAAPAVVVPELDDEAGIWIHQDDGARYLPCAPLFKLNVNVLNCADIELGIEFNTTLEQALHEAFMHPQNPFRTAVCKKWFVCDATVVDKAEWDRIKLEMEKKVECGVVALLLKAQAH